MRVTPGGSVVRLSQHPSTWISELPEISCCWQSEISTPLYRQKSRVRAATGVDASAIKAIAAVTRRSTQSA